MRVKYSVIFMMVILILIFFTVSYNIVNNKRVRVTKENVLIDDLPEVFDGFTILQISDLHEKEFGENQEHLINTINEINYDIVAITGDMQNENLQNDEPLLALLDGIKNKKYIFYVSGNDGPKFSVKLEDKGCISLDTPYEIKRGNSSIMIYDFYDGSTFKDDAKDFDSDVVLGITHYPWKESFYDTAKDKIGKYDLVIAGHYHGGQIRIPFYGALFVPDINGDGFLPNQDDVSGLKTYGEYKQYISKGLGASSEKGVTGFRLFNAPEINLITLVND